MSVNEELQSSNEELETSKEELQSLNEELTTANTQLEGKIAELEATNNDLDNLLTSTNIATLFLDTQLRIRRFTPAATRLFSLIPSDIGRPDRRHRAEVHRSRPPVRRRGGPRSSRSRRRRKCKPTTAAGTSGRSSPTARATTGPKVW